jgi:hypothetical protein
VPAEDHPSAQVRPEGELAAVLVEILVPELGRQRLKRLGRVKAGAGIAQRLFIDIGAVDLNPLGGLVDPQGFSERERERVRLFLGGTAGRPHPDILGALGVGDQLGHYLAPEISPRLDVTEEAGHVDQDGVEQVPEFLGAAFQPVAVINVIADPRLLHSLADAAAQRRPLVPGEIKAP